MFETNYTEYIIKCQLRCLKMKFCFWIKIVRKKTLHNVCCVPLNHRHSKFDHFAFIIYFYPKIRDTMCFSLLEGVSHCFQLRLYSCLFFVTCRSNPLLISSSTTSSFFKVFCPLLTLMFLNMD